MISCPASDGKALTLVFRADPGGPALATAILGLDGCEFTDLTVGAKDRTLGKYGSARSMAIGCSRSLAWPGNSRPSSGRRPKEIDDGLGGRTLRAADGTWQADAP